MLLQKVVEMAKDVSNSRQIIFTTHNPEIIKNVSLESIILIKRDNTGSSVAIRPSNSEAVKCFLENELGLEELFLQNLLGE
jgi:predicted ATP-dependent endonuclease of OLD family